MARAAPKLASPPDASRKDVLRPLIGEGKIHLGAVARFNPSASRAAFPTPRSRHHGVGLRPAEFGHPVQDVTPDHGLSPLRVAVPRLQASSEH